uniref:Metalloendopeptidase n=1 Tax=Astyanax mexicanus TaxID=7994 RepID=A0A3B1KB11_ASTMX
MLPPSPQSPCVILTLLTFPPSPQSPCVILTLLTFPPSPQSPCVILTLLTLPLFLIVHFVELLLEGDIVLPRTRNALVCANNNCFWKKSSTGYDLIIDCKTCIRFVDRTLSIAYFSPPEHGRTGGKQVVSLSTRGCVYHGIVQHELNHALGFYHEHTRSDRDSYVTINWQNIDPTMQYNFNKENTNNLNTPYDYSSVMHYGKTAFTINGLNTITPIPDASVQIGQRVDLSVIDIQRINTLYNC